MPPRILSTPDPVRAPRQRGGVRCWGALAIAVTLVAPGWAAEPADDQYALGAGHYTRKRWALAAEAFAEFLQAYPAHEKAPRALFFQAEAEVQAQRLPEAGQHFREFLTKFPQDPLARQALFRAGEAAYLTGDAATARQELAAFAEQFPDDELNAYVGVYLGELAWAAGETETAAAAFRTVLAKYPQGRLAGDARLGLARSELRLDHFDAAQALWLALADDRESSTAAEALWDWGAALYERRDYAAARERFGRLLAEHAQSPLADRARLGEGWCLYQAGDYGNAEERFRGLAGHSELGTNARYWLSLCLLATERWADAAAQLAPLVEPTHDDKELGPAVLFHSGQAARRLDRAAEAETHWARLVERWPDSEWVDDALLGQAELALARDDHAAAERLLGAARPRLNASGQLAAERLTARSLVEREKFAAAVPLLEKLAAAESDPRLASADRYLWALALERSGNAQASWEALAPLAADSPDAPPETGLLRGAILVDLERFDEAALELERYLARDPAGATRATARAQLAICRARLGREPEARAAYEQFLGDRPPSETLVATTAHLAELAYRAEWWSWAESLFDRLLQEAPANERQAEGLSGRGWSRWKLGRAADAERDFSELLAKYPSDPRAAEAALAAAQLAEQAAPDERALAAYRRLWEGFPDSPEVPAALLASARLNDRLGHEDEADGQYARLADHFAERVPLDAVLYEWSWVRRELGRPDEADDLLRRLRQDWPASPLVPDATYRLAERALAEQRLDEAGQLLDEIDPDRVDAALRPYLLYLRGQLAGAQARWSEVEPPLAQLLRDFPDHPLVLPAEYWLAETDYRQGNWPAAGRRLEGLVPRVAGRTESWAAMVLLRRAQVLAHEEHWSQARELAGQIPGQFPQFEQAYEVDYLTGRCLAAERQFDAAREAYRRVCRSERGAKTETAAQAQLMIGESFFYEEDFAAALREYLAVEILYAFPEISAVALLQAGKCYEQLGEWKQAAEVYARLEEQFPQAAAAAEASRRRSEAETQLTKTGG